MSAVAADLARLAGETDAESLVLERHEVNRGKGAALATGFRRAEELGIPIVENPPVAQLLYKTAQIDREIPEDLYQAVAEVLAYVYRLSGRAA